MATATFYIENNSAYTIRQETYFLFRIDKDNYGVVTHGYTAVTPHWKPNEQHKGVK